MRRIIECQVTDEYVRGDRMVVGAAGSHNDVALRLAFNPMWAGTARSIVWKDALGGNPIITVLGTDLLVPGETEVYIVPIPAEPKAYAGDMSMTIKGAAVDGDKETSATLTARAFFTVMESDWDEDAEETQDITPTQAEQFQAQLEAIKDDIAAAAKAVEETTAIKEAAAQSAESAEQAASTAVSSAAHAQDCAAAAAASQEAAARSETNAEYWAGQASAAAGGDFATKQEAQGYASAAEGNANAYTDRKVAAIPTPDVSGQINTHNADTSAHADIRNIIENLAAADVGAMERLSATAELSLMGWYKIGYFPSTIYPAQAIVMVGNAYTDSEPHMVTAAVSFAGQYSPNIVVLASNQSGNKRNFTKLRIVKDATANGYALETYYAKDALNMAYVTIVGNVDDAKEWTVHAFAPSVAKEAAKLDVTVDEVQSGNALTTGNKPADIGAAPAYTYGTEDLTAGTSPLESGKLYFVYE